MSEQIDAIRADMRSVARSVNFWLRVFFLFLLVSTASGTALLFFRQWVLGGMLLVPAILFLPLLVSGLMIVQPEERIVIEFLGHPYCIKKSGLRWVLRGLMKKRMRVFTWEQPIKLFPEGVHIDFKGGGKAELVEPTLWTTLIGAGTLREAENVLRMVYSVEDWEKAMRENVETALRTHLNNLTVDECLEAIFSADKASWWEELVPRFPNLDETIQGYGRCPTRLTISDFNWDSSVVATRQKVFEEERSIRIAELSVAAAKNEVLQKAMESGGLHGEITRILTGEPYKYTKKAAERVATELVTFFKSADTGRLIDVRSSGAEGGGITSLLASTMAAFYTAKQQFDKSQPPSQQ